MRKRFIKIIFALLAISGAMALVACSGPKVFNYGKGEPNITVEQA